VARILGLDPGTRRCGVAVTDSAQTLAFPREALDVDEDLLASLAALIEQEGAERVVVGRPVALSGGVTASTGVADELYRELVAILGAGGVVQWDERLTTLEAQRSLTDAGMKARRQRGHVDSAAAVIMLQSYLEAHRGA
jgi:putative pre-16S rRNA nuclease